MQLPEYTHHRCTITTGYDTPCIRLEIKGCIIEIFCLGDLKNEKNKKHITWMVWSRLWSGSGAAECLGEGKVKSVKKAKKKAENLIKMLMKNVPPV